jgi:hypothetical protein
MATYGGEGAPRSRLAFARAAPLGSNALTVSITNGSGTTMSLQAASLSAGSWLPPAPAIGTPLQAGAFLSYRNGSDIFSGLGGYLQLVPMTGGTITIGWSWPSGQGASGYAFAQQTSGIGVTYDVINPNTSQPTLQVQLSNTN